MVAGWGLDSRASCLTRHENGLWMDAMLNLPRFQHDKLGSLSLQDVRPSFCAQILPQELQVWIFRFGFAPGREQAGG